jgi:hypothetical protein
VRSLTIQQAKGSYCCSAALQELERLSLLNQVCRTSCSCSEVSLIHYPTVAEQIQRPLYRLSAGDLGTSTTTVEEGLKQTLDRCAHWNCVLLVDEADVFLEARSTDSLQRNELVSSKWIHRRGDAPSRKYTNGQKSSFVFSSTIPGS